VIISLIMAAAANDVIGDRGALPWYLPADLRRFRSLTTGQVVVAGRATQESIVARLGRPLPGRTTVVVSRTLPEGWADEVLHVSALDGALAAAAGLAQQAGRRELFVIGGASVYEQVLPAATRVYLTRIHREVSGDCSLPPGWLDGFTLAARQDLPAGEGELSYSFLDYQRQPA
jgi:dihydrofolate reductase